MFNQIKRSNYGKGWEASNIILQNEVELCHVPTGNACFRKCLESIYKRDFSREHNESKQDSDGCKIIMTSARVQPFCRKHNLHIGVYKLKKGRIFALNS